MVSFTEITGIAAPIFFANLTAVPDATSKNTLPSAPRFCFLNNFNAF